VITARARARIAAAVIVVVGYAAATMAQAQSAQAVPLRELTLEQLGSLEVTTVSKQPAEVWRTPAAITVLTQDDIRRSGVTTLPELLRMVGGVQVSRLDSDHWAIGIRGLTNAFSKALLVLIDGRSVYTPLFGGVYWHVQDTLLEDVDRIEVIRGPGGTIWGSNAVSGVINIITRHSRETPGLLVSAGAGNVDRGRVAVRYGASRGEGLSYRVYANGAAHDAQHHTDGEPFDDWNLAQGGFQLDFTRPRGGSVRIQGDLYQGTMGERVAIGSFAPPARLVVQGDDLVSGGNVLARWERELAGAASLRLQGYYDRTVRNAVHFGEERDTFDVDLLLRTHMARRHQLSWGAGARNSRSNVTPIFSTLSVTPEDRDQRLASVFAQDEIEVLSGRLFVTVGTKLEHNTYSGWEVQPNVRLLWRVDPQETVWGSVTRAVRTPSRIETDLRLTGFGLASPLAYLQLAGSPDFDAENVVAVEAGYRRIFATSFFLDVTAFHNTYEGLAGFSPFARSVQTVPVPHLLFTATYQNAIDAVSDGFELAGDFRPTPWLRTRGSYALLSIDTKNRPGFSDAANLALYQDSVPRHQGSAQVSLTLPRGVEVDYVQRAVGHIVSHEVPRYVTADARVGWTVAPGVQLAVAGQNLFAPGHVEFFRSDFEPVGIRRSVAVSVTWRR
jgi:iron complex outermembrane recepter protein